MNPEGILKSSWSESKLADLMNLTSWSQLDCRISQVRITVKIENAEDGYADVNFEMAGLAPRPEWIGAFHEQQQ